MIKSFHCRETERVFRRMASKKLPPELLQAARRKLLMLDAATQLSDLKVPPNNFLEALRRDRIGQHSIRINAQWRICFVWKGGDAYRVEIADYH